jgi:hypothetical protein
MIRQGWRVRGMTCDEVELVNPNTGDRHPVQRLNVVLRDPQTGAVFIGNRHQELQCKYGDQIPSGAELGFCWTCSEIVCPLHSVICPWCGLLYCLEHSRLMDYEGVIFRVCDNCHHQLRDGLLRKLLRLLIK